MRVALVVGGDDERNVERTKTDRKKGFLWPNCNYTIIIKISNNFNRKKSDFSETYIHPYPFAITADAFKYSDFMLYFSPYPYFSLYILLLLLLLPGSLTSRNMERDRIETIK